MDCQCQGPNQLHCWTFELLSTSLSYSYWRCERQEKIKSQGASQWVITVWFESAECNLKSGCSQRLHVQYFLIHRFCTYLNRCHYVLVKTIEAQTAVEELLWDYQHAPLLPPIHLFYHDLSCHDCDFVKAHNSMYKCWWQKRERTKVNRPHIHDTYF